MATIYESLPYTECMKTTAKTYWYYRYTRTAPRIRLPSPDNNNDKECLAAYHAAAGLMHSPNFQKSLKTRVHGFSALLQRFLKDIGQGRKDSTRKAYNSRLKPALTWFGNKDVRLIDLPDIVELLDHYPASSTANYAAALLVRFWEWMETRDYINQNVVVKIPPRAHKYTGHLRWTRVEIARYRAHWRDGTWGRIVFEVLLNTGCRISDALVIGPQNLLQDNEFEYHAIKNGEKGLNRLSPDFLKSMDHVTKDGLNFIVHPRKRTPMPYSQFYYHFSKCCKAAGIDKTAHGLRRSFGMALARRSDQAPAICLKGAWKRLSSAEIYVQEFQREMSVLESD